MRLFFFANWTDEKTKAAVSVVDEGDAARSAFEGRESSAIGRGVPLISGRRVALTAKRRLRGAAYIHLAWVRRACPRIRFQGPSAGFVFFLSTQLRMRHLRLHRRIQQGVHQSVASWRDVVVLRGVLLFFVPFQRSNMIGLRSVS